jgi:putative DNA primase/helicase
VPPDAIPSELRELNQWVLWRYEERDGKPTKVPYQPASPNRKASTTDPSTWGTFEDAIAAEAEGVGFVFTPDDPFAGVDLDDCVTDGVIHPDALALVRQLDSYTELNPSGTGLHVILRARIPDGGPNRTSKTPWGGVFENYDRDRFFCMTGRHI